MAKAAHACTQDIERHCPGLDWGQGLASCLESNRPKLSSACQKQVEVLTRRHNRFQHVRNTCRKEVEDLCNQITPGQGRVLSCLKQNESRTQGSCRAELQKITPQTTG